MAEDAGNGTTMVWDNRCRDPRFHLRFVMSYSVVSGGQSMADVNSPGLVGFSTSKSLSIASGEKLACAAPKRAGLAIEAPESLPERA